MASSSRPRTGSALASALIRVLADVSLRCSLGANARQRVQEYFSAELIVPRVQALWHVVLQEGASVGVMPSGP